MKVAIVYDWMDSMGGVERLLVQLHRIFPEAVFFTSVYDPKRASWAGEYEVRPSFIQRLPGFIRKSRLVCLPLYPYAFESFDFSGYDLVISVTSAFAKGVVVKPGTKHVCVLLSPPRYLWDLRSTYIPQNVRTLSAPLTDHLRRWDWIAAQRIDSLLAISSLVADRAQKHYRREVSVVHPPLDIDYWNSVQDEAPAYPPKGEFYLVVARLEKYKRIDLTIETFATQPEKQLIIVGSGKHQTALLEGAPPNVHFLHHISEEDLLWHYRHAKALIMPQEEDYGYTALEALYAGCPVISYRHSGTRDIVVEGKTGLFFDEQTTASLTDALARFEAVSYNVESHSKKILESFSVDEFTRQLQKYLQIKQNL